jgi:ParB family chromosome partitioning protein
VIRQAVHTLIHQSTSVEWRTPPQYLAAARALMGAIDLDPASCEEANRLVQAARFYTVEDDGLGCPWSGRVWLNPPYGKRRNKSVQGLWATRLALEYAAGTVKEAVLLVNAQTGEQWFQPLWQYPICFVGRRIRFIGQEGKKGPTHGSALVYFGRRPARFAEIFRPFGRVVMPESVTDTRNARCAHCGESFLPGRGDARFCSAACRQRAYRRRRAAA